MGEHLPEDVFNILVATDIHLGYNEKDPIRGKKQKNLPGARRPHDFNFKI